MTAAPELWYVVEQWIADLPCIVKTMVLTLSIYLLTKMAYCKLKQSCNGSFSNCVSNKTLMLS